MDNLNITGNAVISITDNSAAGNRVAFDDLSWTCYTLGTSETSTASTLIIYPNPVVNDVLFVSGPELKKVLKADIYSLDGRLIQTIARPFLSSNRIKLNNLKSGVYVLSLDSISFKFIVK